VQADLIDIGRRVSVPASRWSAPPGLLEPALAEHGESEGSRPWSSRRSRGGRRLAPAPAFSQRERMEDVVDLVIAETVCVC